MSEMILADQVRSFVFHKYLEKSAPNTNITVTVGDIHSSLGFQNRVPLVVSALDARKFYEQYGLELVEKLGPSASTTTTFTIRRVVRSPAVSPAHWVEVTSLEHGHGGRGWEFGYWLWSPAKAGDGSDRYVTMKQVKPGDKVLHFLSGVIPGRPRERLLYGISEVAEAAKETNTKPPLPGPWEDAKSYLRVRLANFLKFETEIEVSLVELELKEVILAELANPPKHFLYSRYGDKFRITQGAYLTSLSPSLSIAFNEVICALNAVDGESLHKGRDVVRDALREFAEGERTRREHSFFRRNPSLRKDAIAAHGLTCVACGLNFGEKYGKLGDGYIEVHHLNPLSEREGCSIPSTVNDVITLCANCHRMVHRQRPALIVDDLKLALKLARESLCQDKKAEVS